MGEADPKAKADNKRAAYDAYDAVKKFPNDREAAADYVHERWIKRNKGDTSQPKALFKAVRALARSREGQGPRARRPHEEGARGA